MKKQRVYIFNFKIGINYVVGWYFFYTKYIAKNIYSVRNNNSKVWKLRTANKFWTAYINFLMKISIWDLHSNLIILFKYVHWNLVLTLISFSYFDYICYYCVPRDYVSLKKGQ